MFTGPTVAVRAQVGATVGRVDGQVSVRLSRRTSDGTRAGDHTPVRVGRAGRPTSGLGHVADTVASANGARQVRDFPAADRHRRHGRFRGRALVGKSRLSTNLPPSIMGVRGRGATRVLSRDLYSKTDYTGLANSNEKKLINIRVRKTFEKFADDDRSHRRLKSLVIHIVKQGSATFLHSRAELVNFSLRTALKKLK